jgi:hypothetical protein
MIQGINKKLNEQLKNSHLIKNGTHKKVFMNDILK